MQKLAANDPFMKRSQSDLSRAVVHKMEHGTLGDISLMRCTVTLEFFSLLLKWIVLHLPFLSSRESHHSHHSHCLNTALIHLEEWVE